MTTREDTLKEDSTLQAGNADILLHTDGSGYKGEIGGAAVMYKWGHPPKALCKYFGLATRHIFYEGEAVGAILGAHLIGEEVGQECRRDSPQP